MSAVNSVKPQRLEYVEQTREAILGAAEQLFVERGFRATSIDAVGSAARFTKGAVYRHFPDKQALFQAVFERVEVATVEELQRRVLDAAGAADAARVAMEGFLEVAPQERFRRIVLEEGPIALGYREWRELDHHYTAALLERLLSALIEEGRINDAPVGPLARMCCALIGEAAVQLVEATSGEEAARADVLAALAAVLGGLDLVAR
ncbi:MULTISPECIES: TetR/AcrR family transcriptional regulator [unclassified Pseudonocardia]|uniref:TetR/AcrR family transcriptional regulator n=1 Tax=unclassified Pseudonocardia TaxID=2619320 RepID=UPI0001FFE430|nr:TetR/AcrR family transcriptional regulator [Pseudonocardia sp. Ae707_Ps1]OLM18611.1 Transcriptional regulator, TetR family [Pseudonocardia sp. Ae707_Ps1]